MPYLNAPVLASILRGLLVVGVLGSLACLIVRDRSRSPRYLALEYGVVIVAMLLVGPLVEDIHYTYLAIPLIAAAVVLGAHWRSRPAPIALGVALVAASLYLFIPTLRAVHFAFYAHYDGPLSGLSVLLTGAHVYGLLAVAGATFAILFWAGGARLPVLPFLRPGTGQRLIASE